MPNSVGAYTATGDVSGKVYELRRDSNVLEIAQIRDGESITSFNHEVYVAADGSQLRLKFLIRLHISLEGEVNIQKLLSDWNCVD
jgi:hypothetical protein